MAIKLVTDSSSNLTMLEGVTFASVPLTIITEEKQYRDDETLDVHQMMLDLQEITSKTSTACPGPGDWLGAFEGADEIIVITITSKLSGAYNSALAAVKLYQEDHPNAKVFVLDTLSTGPEQELIVEEAARLIKQGIPYDEICERLTDYAKHTHLGFSLESLQNFVRNGRVNPALAKVVSMMRIRIVGKASDVGDLEAMNKCPGKKKAVLQCFDNMKLLGYIGGRVRIRHTENFEAAINLQALIKEAYPDSEITIHENRGLCAYYTELGGLLVGFECQ